MDLGLEHTRALVVGGSRGIGKQVALGLAQEGASVAIAARDAEKLQATAEELSATAGRPLFAARADTRDDASVRAMVATVAEHLGGIDVLVNAAARPGGQAPPARYDALRAEDLLEEIDTKVMGYLRCVQAAAPHLISSGRGRIVNVSGLAARRTGSIVGSARNVAVNALSANLADELAVHHIAVNVVHPGMTVTEAMTVERAAQLAGTNLLGRLVDAAEVASVVVFLCSPRAVALNAAVLDVGGGTPGLVAY